MRLLTATLLALFCFSAGVGTAQPPAAATPVKAPPKAALPSGPPVIPGTLPVPLVPVLDGKANNQRKEELDALFNHLEGPPVGRMIAEAEIVKYREAQRVGRVIASNSRAIALIATALPSGDPATEPTYAWQAYRACAVIREVVKQNEGILGEFPGASLRTAMAEALKLYDVDKILWGNRIFARGFIARSDYIPHYAVGVFPAERVVEALLVERSDKGKKEESDRLLRRWKLDNPTTRWESALKVLETTTTTKPMRDFAEQVRTQLGGWIEQKLEFETTEVQLRTMLLGAGLNSFTLQQRPLVFNELNRINPHLLTLEQAKSLLTGGCLAAGEQGATVDSKEFTALLGIMSEQKWFAGINPAVNAEDRRKLEKNQAMTVRHGMIATILTLPEAFVTAEDIAMLKSAAAKTGSTANLKGAPTATKGQTPVIRK